MKINKNKLLFLAAAFGILCIGAILVAFIQDDSSSVDPLIAEKAAGYQVATVQVKEDGFEPKQIELQAGVPAKINFKKSSRFTCKDLGIIDAPLATGNNIVALPELKPGTYRYHCGMYMFDGVITVK
ncbi:cupredoxin domain-containing protein [Paenibacillus elgii]|uniref:cupredoxin domain-containing protein n=1 Tax=Paenibacillus elgii TaxID=189691 RepID=UPI000248CF84|nr:cupredoxin domain-containing protein [Paenibacillus elgii]